MEWWVWLIIAFVIMGMIGDAEEQKKKREAQKEMLKRRKEAEDYIMSSGDPEAIKMLMLARANPANYGQILAGGMNNRGSNTLKTALGVMTGVAAGNLVANAITASAISSAMQANLTALNVDVSNAGSDFDFDIFS
jgi:large-conductance mechanosensitive channel